MLVLVIGDLHLPLRAHDLPQKFRKLLVPGKIQQIICTGNVCDKDTYDYLRTVAGDVHVVKGDYDDNPHFPSSLILHHPPLRIGVLHGHQVVPAGDTDQLASLARAMDADIFLSGHTHRFEAFELDGRFFVNPGSATGAWSALWPVLAEGEKADPESEAKGGAEEAANPADKEAAASGEVDEAPQKPEPEADKALPGAPAKDGEDGKEDTEEKAATDAKEGGDAEASKKPEAKPKPLKQAPGPIPSFALLDVQGAVVVTYVYQLIDGEVKVEKLEYRKPAPDPALAAAQANSASAAAALAAQQGQGRGIGGVMGGRQGVRY